jgi:hypothetical protein
LHAAAQSKTKSSEAVVKMILAHPKINVNLIYERGRSALMLLLNLTTTTSSEETVKMLIDHPDIDINHRDDQGHTALMFATGFNNIPNIVRMLLKHPKINVNAQNNIGRTALMAAVLIRNERTMIEIGGHPDSDFFIRDRNGLTAFEICPSDRCKGLLYAMIRSQYLIMDGSVFQRNVSSLLNLRRLRDYLCENLSNQANRADLVVLARFMKLPVAPDATKSDICRDISDVLSAGHWHYRETTFRAQKAKRSADSATILPILDIFRERLREVAGIDPEGKTIQQLLDELNRLL